MLLILLLWTPLLHAQRNTEKAQGGFLQREDPDKILVRVHQRLIKIERFTSPKPLLFVGEISRLGPPCQGIQGICICKGAISEDVDFTIDHLLFGEHQDALVHTSYVNCSSSPLPAPPFTLHEKQIVYCELQPDFVRCFDPVKLTDERLKRVEAWITALRPREHATR